MPNFLLLYCSLQDQWLDTAYSPDSANYLEVSTYSGQWTLKHALIWLTKDKLKLVPWRLSASISSNPLWESPNYQGILPSLLSNSQRQLCSSSQPYKVRALTSYDLSLHANPHGSVGGGSLHAPLLQTITAARITDLEDPRFPRSEKHLPGICPRV